jgi:ABC-type lipoprotein release transport system permease subunit
MRTWIGKQRYLIDFTVSCLVRRKVKNCVLLLVYTSIVFLLASVMLFTQALRREAAALLARSPEVIVQRMVAGRHDLIPAGYLERVGRMRGVQKAEARLWGYYFDRKVKANYTFMAAPASEASLVAPGRIAVGAAMARERGIAPGNSLYLQSYSGQPFTFTVNSVFPESSDLLAADLVLMTERDFRAFFEYPDGFYTDIVLSVANPQQVGTVAAKIAAALPNSRPILREEILRTYEAVFNWREGVVFLVLFGSVLAFVILAFEKASGLSADERREIGILKAIGWETADVIRMKFWEGALLSLTAFLAGYCAAYLHVFRLSAALFESVLKGWSVLYPHIELRPEPDGFQVATLFFFTVFPYTLATVVPIWRAAITDPDAVMRG